MPTEFRSWLSYWNFVRSVANRRFVHDRETQEFLTSVLETGRKRREVLPAGAHLWRAQPGHGVETGDEETGYQIWGLDEERMKPTVEFAVEGRSNPKGILHLYLATERETALAEVGRWSGPELSAAQFKTLRPLEIINFTLDERPKLMVFGDEPSAELRERYVWADINRAFSKPVARSDSSADYVPTQIISEVFKANGFDGVAYQSSLGPCHSGHNIVLFDVAAVEFVACIPFETIQIEMTFREAGNPYWRAK